LKFSRSLSGKHFAVRFFLREIFPAFCSNVRQFRARLKDQSFASNSTSDFMARCRTPQPDYYNLDTSKIEWKDK
jgi:hypothetical protein